jgi:pimeloyl-ACP methyl ester carboxylesterase
MTQTQASLPSHFPSRTLSLARAWPAAVLWLVLVALCATGCASSTPDSPANPQTMQNQPTYRFIQRWDVTKLNQILSTDTPSFFGTKVAYTPATNAVDLYRVYYHSAVPEKGDKPIAATGLLAVPVLKGSSFPVVSYQHGTVFRKSQVPSIPEQSPETQLMIAQFAGQGYILMAADYFGMGATQEPQGYLVKASHQRACFDMLQSGRQIIKTLGLSENQLYLAGWSQGGFVTLAFSEYLEELSQPTVAVATASAPSEAFASLSGFLMFPRKIDPDWANMLFILTAFSYEEYYGLPGLGRSLIQAEHYQLCRDFYDDKDVDYAKIPTDLKKLIKPEFFNATYFENSTYGKALKNVEVNRRIVQTPTRTYYGGSDEVIPVGMGQLVQTYQMASGSGNTKAQAISAGDDATHRFTYARAVPQWKLWFDSLAKK